MTSEFTHYVHWNTNSCLFHVSYGYVTNVVIFDHLILHYERPVKLFYWQFHNYRTWSHETCSWLWLTVYSTLKGMYYLPPSILLYLTHQASVFHYLLNIYKTQSNEEHSRENWTRMLQILKPSFLDTLIIAWVLNSVLL